MEISNRNNPRDNSVLLLGSFSKLTKMQYQYDKDMEKKISMARSSSISLGPIYESNRTKLRTYDKLICLK